MQQTVRVAARLPCARPGGGCVAPEAGGGPDVQMPRTAAFQADPNQANLNQAGLMLCKGGDGVPDAARTVPEPGWTVPEAGRAFADGGGPVALVVLGMHRSGTSAMARVLSLLGGALPATLMPARIGNESGHWESEAICALDDALLESVGSHWADWRPVAPEAGWVMRGQRVLREEFGAAGLFVMKDPRQCRLMPFWRDVLAAEGVGARVVLTLRHPWDVAQSLARRDGMGAARAQLLWLGHMLEAEAGSRGMTRVLCPYDALMAVRGEQALATWAQDLGERLGVGWPHLSPRALGEMAAFLDPAARHHAVEDDPVPVDLVSHWAGRVHAVLSAWAVDGEQARDHAELDAIARALARAGPDLMRMVEENEALAGDVARGRGELAEARSELAEARGALAGALEWLGDERREATRLQAEAVAAREERDEAREALGVECLALAAGRGRLAEMEAALAHRDAALAMRDDVVARRQADLLELAALRDALVAERVELAGRIDGLEQARDEAEGWVLRLARERHGLERAVMRGARRMAAMERDLARGAAREQGLAAAVACARAQGDEQVALARREGQAALAAAERDHGDRLAHCHALAQADLEQMRAELEVLRQAGREVVVVPGPDPEVARQELTERYREIATLTLMLCEQVEAARRHEGEAAWMRGIWAAMERAPGWWSWVPGGLRRRLRDGWLARRGLFDARAYRAEHRDVAAAGMDALAHYILHGMGEGRAAGVVEG